MDPRPGPAHLPNSGPDHGLNASSDGEIRRLLDEYLRMYATRDDQLTSWFSEDFSGFTGGGNFLVKNREEWVAITRQDFAQVKDAIRIERKDVAIQPLADGLAVATAFFTIHLPIKDAILSRETARLVLIFRRESQSWRICHSSISIPYHLVREGEVYPMKELVDRNEFLEKLVAERTTQLTAANDRLRQTNGELANAVAEHEHAAAALRASEERYRSILTASPDDITITDTDGRILMVSPMAHTIFRGQPDTKFIGVSVLDFIVPADRPRALAQIALRRRGVITGASEYRGVRVDGSTFDIEVNSEFIRDVAGAPAGMVVIVRDITERKRAEAEREKLEAQNRQLQKAESLGRMAGAIAHHFNNQLQGVMMSLELATDTAGKAGVSLTDLTGAMHSARKAAEVSRLMLTYLGQANVLREPLDLSEVCRESLALLSAAKPKNVALQTELPSPGPSISGNANQIQQVLANLVTNAWEAAEGGEGSIRVVVKTCSATGISSLGRFPIEWQTSDSAYACVEVADTGCGIAAKDIEQLFDPFFSSKFTGRGLGLAVVLGIARTHGGSVVVQSEPHRGSIFRVFLPLTATAIPPRRGAPIESPGQRSGGAVLVVDDEPAVLEGASIALKLTGHAVFTAEDGVEAVEKFRQHQTEIGCVVCDLTMPRMNGWETLAALRQLSPGIPVVITSGYSHAQAMAGHHPELPTAFLHKPYSFEELRRVLGQCLPAKRPNA